MGTQITFRPLRLNKKTGKIMVASYMQWNKVRVLNDYHSGAKVLIDQQYKSFPKNALVHNHKGETLFWRIDSPVDLPTLNYIPDFDWDKAREDNPLGFFLQGQHNSTHVGQLDCTMTPAFSHYTQKYIATHYDDMSLWEPLTVATVQKWFGWFLYNCENLTSVK